jgi:endonuclease/exonuclease/phosphatase family metal-dependent hydrolase
MRIVTLNVWCPNLFGIVKAKRIGPRLDLIESELRRLKPDIVCLQEVWDRRARRRLRAVLPDFESYLPPCVPRWQPWGSGLLTLSRYPIVRRRFTPMPRPTRRKEAIARKGVAATHHRLPDGRIIGVLNVHNGLLGTEARRAAQADTIAAAARDLPDPAIVAGDMNSMAHLHYCRSCSPLPRLRALGYTDAHAHALDPGSDPAGSVVAHAAHTFTPRNTNIDMDLMACRTDYIFVRGVPPHAIRDAGLCFHEPNEGPHASDHFGVFCDLDLTALDA